MLIRESRDVLLGLLAEEGIRCGLVDVPTPETFLSVFLRFAAITVDDAGSVEEDGDGLLAQFGTYSFRGRREFSADLTRQLIAGDHPDATMWQLSCTFHWQPTPRTDELGSGQLWSFGKSTARFLDEVRALPGWAWALATPARPAELAISLERV